jgi:hypothetical protein
MSAVSRKVTPSSIARWMVAIDYGLVLVAGAVKLAHAHTAQAQLRHPKPLFAQNPLIHVLLLFSAIGQEFICSNGTLYSYGTRRVLIDVRGGY